jgi:hypothetical protein
VDNYSTEYGGAICIEKNNFDVLISKSTFTDNFAMQGGGAIYVTENNYDISVQDCAFVDNAVGVVSPGGGAINIFNINDGIEVARSYFSGNDGE